MSDKTKTPPNDLQLILSRPVTITIRGGRTVASAVLDLDDNAALQQWLDDQQPDAFVAADREIARRDHSVEIQKFLYRQALELNASHRVELGSLEANRILDSYRGKLQQIKMSLRKGTKDITDAEIKVVLAAMQPSQAGLVIATAGALRADEDPKAGGGPPASTDAAGSTSGESSID